MKTRKITNRIFALLMAAVMLMSMSATAFAAEVPDSNVENFNSEKVAVEVAEVASTTAEEKTIPAWGSTKFYYDKLNPLPASFHISTSSSSTQGAIIVTAFNTNNPELELSDDWVMGPNDYASWTLITMAGTVIIQVNNHSPQPVDVRVWY